MATCGKWDLLCKWQHRNDADKEALTDTIPSQITELSKWQLGAIAGTGLLIIFLLNR